jgi:hypothetical protein
MGAQKYVSVNKSQERFIRDNHGAKSAIQIAAELKVSVFKVYWNINLIKMADGIDNDPFFNVHAYENWIV